MTLIPDKYRGIFRLLWPFLAFLLGIALSKLHEAQRWVVAWVKKRRAEQ